MRRIGRQAQAEPVAAATSALPGRLKDLLADVPVLAGVDPVFVGLHRYRDTDDGRSYKDTMHVAYPCHQLHLPTARRETTIVCPAPPEERSPLSLLHSLVHELGHVLDERLGFEHWFVPVTRYAATSRGEAFAEAFWAWWDGPQAPYYRWVRKPDPYASLEGRAIALFDSLAFP